MGGHHRALPRAHADVVAQTRLEANTVSLECDEGIDRFMNIAEMSTTVYLSTLTQYLTL